jgi:uncharacterized phiE125 gp8 family phage protein
MKRLEITAPYPVGIAGMPMTYAEAKVHCRIDIDDEQAFIEGLIETATELIEYATQKKFVERKFRLSWDRGEICSDILTLEQFDSGLTIDSFKQFDDTEPTAGETDVSTDDYILLDNRVQLRGDFPSVSLRKYSSIKIEYTVASAPRSTKLKETIGLIVSHWWLNRETVSVDNKDLKNLPLGIITAIQSMRVPSV